jgi:hypothetical protein
MTEHSDVLVLFPEASSKLTELATFIEQAHEDLSDMMLVEFSAAQLRACGELTELQAQRLLERGLL